MEGRSPAGILVLALLSGAAVRAEAPSAGTPAAPPPAAEQASPAPPPAKEPGTPGAPNGGGTAAAGTPGENTLKPPAAEPKGPTPQDPAAAAEPPPLVRIADFEKIEDLKRWSVYPRGHLEPSAACAVSGEKSGRLTSPVSLKIRVGEAGTQVPADWTPYDALRLEARNPQNRSVTLVVSLQGGARHDEQVEVPASSSCAIALDLSRVKAEIRKRPSYLTFELREEKPLRLFVDDVRLERGKPVRETPPGGPGPIVPLPPGGGTPPPGAIIPLAPGETPPPGAILLPAEGEAPPAGN